MRNLTALLGSAILILSSTAAMAQAKTKYKCMIQMNSYMGEGAYIAVSLVKNAGSYEQTLYILGADKKWYPNLKEWHKAYKKKPADINGITGASVAGGDRAMITLEIDDSKLDAGYKIRFESSVENKGYQPTDVEVPLSRDGLSAKTEGKGFIRYVRFSSN